MNRVNIGRHESNECSEYCTNYVVKLNYAKIKFKFCRIIKFIVAYSRHCTCSVTMINSEINVTLKAHNFSNSLSLS